MQGKHRARRTATLSGHLLLSPPPAPASLEVRTGASAAQTILPGNSLCAGRLPDSLQASNGIRKKPPGVPFYFLHPVSLLLQEPLFQCRSSVFFLTTVKIVL